MRNIDRHKLYPSKMQVLPEGFEIFKTYNLQQAAAMLGIFAARSKNLHDIVLTGNLTSIPQARPIFDDLQKIFDVNFIIPEHAQFSTAIGAALA